MEVLKEVAGFIGLMLVGVVIIAALTTDLEPLLDLILGGSTSVGK